MHVFSEWVHCNGLGALTMTEGHKRWFFRSPRHSMTVSAVHLATRAVGKRVVTSVVCLMLCVLVKCIDSKHAVCGGCVFARLCVF